MKSGWVTKKLGEVCEINYGTRVRRKDSRSDDYPVYGGGGETFRWETFNREDQCVVSRFAMSPECVRFVSGKFFLNDSGLTVDTASDGLWQNYLDWCLFGKQDVIYALGKGSAQKNLDMRGFVNVSIPIPPLSEQKRIVKKIDAAFEKIDALKANAEKNLANAKELFQSALDEAMRPKKGWVEKRLGELGETLTGMTPSTKDKSNFGDCMPFVKPGDIAPFSQIQFRADGLSRKGVGLSRLIKKDSVLMVCIGASIGKTGYTDRDCTCNQQINALMPKGFSGRYLYYLLSSDKFKAKLIDESGQTTLPIISKSKWENLTVSVSDSLIEQHEIVKQLDFLSEKVKLLGHNYTQQIADCAEMRQAILREAFEGRL